MRTVPLPQSIVDTLAAHLAAHPTASDQLMFVTAHGNPWRRNRFGETIRRTFDRAGVPDEAFHSCRHFYASLLIAQGLSVKVVQQRLGHASAVETLDTYGHLWPDSDDDTRAAVDNVLRDALAR